MSGWTKGRGGCQQGAPAGVWGAYSLCTPRWHAWGCWEEPHQSRRGEVGFEPVPQAAGITHMLGGHQRVAECLRCARVLLKCSQQKQACEKESGMRSEKDQAVGE